MYGGEKVFAAGADVKEMAEHVLRRHGQARSGRLQSAFTAVARIPKPVVAAVTGYALGGGCELALCADVRFAAEDAELGQPEILLGIIPGAGGTQRLTRLVGPSRAKDIIFTGRFVKADEALRHRPGRPGRPGRGRCTPRRWPGPRSSAGAASYALRAAKEAIDRGLEVDLDTGLEIERQQFAALFATEDRATGMRSFVENGPGKAELRGPLIALGTEPMADEAEHRGRGPRHLGCAPPRRTAPWCGPGWPRTGGAAAVSWPRRCSWPLGALLVVPCDASTETTRW